MIIFTTARKSLIKDIYVIGIYVSGIQNGDKDSRNHCWSFLIKAQRWGLLLIHFVLTSMMWIVHSKFTQQHLNRLYYRHNEIIESLISIEEIIKGIINSGRRFELVCYFSDWIRYIKNFIHVIETWNFILKTILICLDLLSLWKRSRNATFLGKLIIVLFKKSISSCIFQAIFSSTSE